MLGTVGQWVLGVAGACFMLWVFGVLGWMVVEFCKIPFEVRRAKAGCFCPTCHGQGVLIGESAQYQLGQYKCLNGHVWEAYRIVSGGGSRTGFGVDSYAP